MAQVTGVLAVAGAWLVRRISGLDWLLFALLALAFVCIGIAVWQGIRFRRVVNERTALAARLKWQLVQAHPGFVDALRGFPFGQGKNQQAQIVAFGPYADTYGAAFTYEFTRGSGRFAHLQEYDVVVLELPTILPAAYILPRDSVEAAKTLAGLDQSTFEVFEFNEAWRVTGPNKRFVHALVQPLLIEALLTISGGATPVCVTNGAIYTWTAKRLTAVQQVDLLKRLDAVRRTIPDFVWKDFGGNTNGRLTRIYGAGDILTRLRAEQD